MLVHVKQCERRHEDFGTTIELYAQSEIESMRDAQGKFFEQLMGDKIHLLTEGIVAGIVGGRFRLCAAKSFRMMVARDGIEPPTPAFSGL